MTYKHKNVTRDRQVIRCSQVRQCRYLEGLSIDGRFRSSHYICGLKTRYFQASLLLSFHCHALTSGCRPSSTWTRLFRGAAQPSCTRASNLQSTALSPWRPDTDAALLYNSLNIISYMHNKELVFQSHGASCNASELTVLQKSKITSTKLRVPTYSMRI